MDDAEFDAKLVTAAFALAAEEGWGRVRVARAARAACLPLDRARARFAGSGAILRRFGRMADQAALAVATPDGPVRDRLFDLLMQRLEFLQAHRAGVLALLRDLPFDPPLALLLAAESRRSIAWLLEAAGADSTGMDGALRVSGAMAVWLWTLRAWQRDESEDLAKTMTVLDQSLSRAEQAAGWLRRGGRRVATTSAAEAEALPVALSEASTDTSDSLPPAV